MAYKTEINDLLAEVYTNSKSMRTEEFDKLELIKKLKELLDLGAITKEEFEEKKNELLGTKTKTTTKKRRAAIFLWASLGFTAFSYIINVIISLNVGGNLFWMFDYILYGYIAGFICMGVGIAGYTISFFFASKVKEAKGVKIVSLLLMIALLCFTLSPLVLHDPITYARNNDGTYGVSNCEYRRKNVTVPNTYKGVPVTTINQSAFRGHNKLITLKIESGITTIGKYAFDSSQNLESVIIPESVALIEENAFLYCNSVVIYCEAEEKPEGWVPDWNCTFNDYGSPINSNWRYATVYWANEWKYDWRGNPVLVY